MKHVTGWALKGGHKKVALKVIVKLSHLLEPLHQDYWRVNKLINYAVFLFFTF